MNRTAKHASSHEKWLSYSTVSQWQQTLGPGCYTAPYLYMASAMSTLSGSCNSHSSSDVVLRCKQAAQASRALWVCRKQLHGLFEGDQEAKARILDDFGTLAHEQAGFYPGRCAHPRNALCSPLMPKKMHAIHPSAIEPAPSPTLHCNNSFGRVDRSGWWSVTRGKLASFAFNLDPPVGSSPEPGQNCIVAGTNGFLQNRASAPRFLLLTPSYYNCFLTC